MCKILKQIYATSPVPVYERNMAHFGKRISKKVPWLEDKWHTIHGSYICVPLSDAKKIKMPKRFIVVRKDLRLNKKIHVVLHEIGHAIDWTKRIKRSNPLKELIAERHAFRESVRLGLYSVALEIHRWVEDWSAIEELSKEDRPYIRAAKKLKKTREYRSLVRKMRKGIKLNK